MRIPKCNPEVYRLAAELIDNEDEFWSCVAIDVALRRLNRRDKDMHVIQYSKMFGPYCSTKSGEIKFDNQLKCFDFWRYYIDGGIHPFWNQRFNEERKQSRVMALLMMAEICENN